jgi:hypothetical protein
VAEETVLFGGEKPKSFFDCFWLGDFSPSLAVLCARAGGAILKKSPVLAVRKKSSNPPANFLVSSRKYFGIGENKNHVNPVKNQTSDRT